MRVCIISCYPPQQSGVADYSKHLVDSMSNVSNRRDEVYVICGSIHVHQLLQTKEKSRNVHIIRTHGISPLDYLFVLIRSVLTIRPHIVHIQHPQLRTSYTGLIGEPLLFLLFFLKLTGRIPTVITMHDVWPLSRVVERAKRFCKYKMFALIMAGYFYTFQFIMLRLITQIITHSNFAKELLIHLYYIPESKIKVFPHGVIPVPPTVNASKAKSELKINFEHVILCFGFIWPNKGIEFILRAMPELSKSVGHTCLLLVGPLHPIDGPRYLKEILKLVREIKMERFVRIHPYYIPENKVPLYFSAASLVVLPNTVVLGSSGVLYKAFSYRKPVIATNIGCRPEELDFGRRGILVAPASAKGLTNAVHDILKNSEVRTKIINGVELYIRENTWDMVARKTMNMYNDLVQNQSTKTN